VGHVVDIATTLARCEHKDQVNKPTEQNAVAEEIDF
jgi:hypothetical protein